MQQPTQPSGTIEAPKFGALCFLFLVVLSTLLAILCVYRQADLIENKVGFFCLAVILLFLAFVFSAVESAFSVSHRDPDVSAAIVPELRKAAEEYAGLAKKSTEGIDALTRAERRRRNLLERRSERIARIRRILNAPGGRRIDIVGSLSALSVFANTALASFLPVFLIDGDVPSIDLAGLPLAREKVLIFVATALPIIYLGKIIPKTIGVRYPVRFAYRLFPVGNLAFYIIGWMPRGLHWLLVKGRLLR